MAAELTDSALTEILGPKCPDCGWRGGRHRPAAGPYPACPQWTYDQP